MTSHVYRRRTGIVVAAAFALGLGACDSFEDLKSTFKTCQDTTVVLSNSPQTIDDVNLIGPDETAGPQNLLRSGESRQIQLCLEKGDRKHFRVLRPNGGLEIAAVNCVASLADYQAHYPVVVWTPEGIHCDGW